MSFELERSAVRYVAAPYVMLTVNGKTLDGTDQHFQRRQSLSVAPLLQARFQVQIFTNHHDR